MILLDIRVVADPLVANLDLAAASAHPAEQLAAQLRVGCIALPRIDQPVNLGDGFLRDRKYTAGAAEGDAAQLFTVFGHKVACDHRTHAVTVEEVRQVRIKLADKCFELMFVLHHRMEALMSQSPQVLFSSAVLAVSDVVIGGNDITGLP